MEFRVMNTYGSFQELMTGTTANVISPFVNGEVLIENANPPIGGYGNQPQGTGTQLDSAVPPVNPVQKTSEKEAMPQWGQTLTGRVNNLEKDVKQNTADIQEIKKTTGEILRKISGS
jgi:hypothetical protein